LALSTCPVRADRADGFGNEPKNALCVVLRHTVPNERDAYILSVFNRLAQRLSAAFAKYLAQRMLVRDEKPRRATAHRLDCTPELRLEILEGRRIETTDHCSVSATPVREPILPLATLRLRPVRYRYDP